MSLFTNIRDDVEAPFEKLWEIVSPALLPILKAFLDSIKANGGKVLLNLALQVFTAAEAGTPWGQLVTALIAAAEAEGIKLTEVAAGNALQVAKNQVASITPAIAAPLS